MMTIKMLGTMTLVATSTFVAGCASMQPAFDYQKPQINAEIVKTTTALPENNEINFNMKQGILMLDSGEYEDALDYFQAGLRLNPKNGHLHFLHGLTYHLQSLSGDSTKLDLAETGYRLAVKFDPGNFWAAYFLGQIYFTQQRYIDAENMFAYGLLFAPDNTMLLRAQSVASYYTQNIGISKWAASKAMQLSPDHPDTVRAMIFSRAATGDIDGAKDMLHKYERVSQSDKHISEDNSRHISSVKTLASRINDWNNYHQDIVKVAASDHHQVFGTDAQAEGKLLDINKVPDLDDHSDSGDPGKREKTDDLNLPRMAVIDVIIMRTEESRFQRRGVNLLAGLEAMLQGILYQRTNTRSTSYGSDASENTTTYFSPRFEFTGLVYNFNIFNDGVNKAEVLARPSLLAVEEKTSKFYSGAVLHVQLSSNNADGSLVDIPVGIHLDVTPHFHNNETIEVVVHAKRDSIESKFEEAEFTTFSQTASTSVDATAIMKFGETLILSGLSEHDNERSKSGVPLLQNIPIIQYLFSREEELQVKKSVVVMLTPRRPTFVNGQPSMNDIDLIRKQANQKQVFTKKLRNKYNIKMTSNLDAAFEILSGSDLYRNFQNGDMKLDDWHNSDTLAGALHRTLDFLYY